MVRALAKLKRMCRTEIEKKLLHVGITVVSFVGIIDTGQERRGE